MQVAQQPASAPWRALDHAVEVAVAVRHLLTGDGASDGVPGQEHLDVNAVTPG